VNWEALGTRAIDKSVIWGLRAIVAVVLVVAIFAAARWSRRALLQALDSGKVDPTLGRFAGNAIYWGILAFALIAGMGAVGIETSSLAALIGGASVTIGLALKDSLGNVAAGLLLLILRPFRVGDLVSVAGAAGRVTDIELLVTRIDTLDNRQIVVPNGTIVRSNIENFTRHPVRRVEAAVTLGIHVSLDEAREALLAAAWAIEGISEDEPPQVELFAGGPDVEWRVRVWCSTVYRPVIRERLVLALVPVIARYRLPYASPGRVTVVE